MVELTDITKLYCLGDVKVRALDSVNLKISQGEFSAISGPSGSGKTTLLNLIGLIDTPSSGIVTLEGLAINHKKRSDLHKIRLSKIGYIFQNFNLMPVLNAYENVEYPLLLTGLSAQKRKIRVEKVLKEVGLWQHRKHRPNELSGGQRQRVAIARALINNPMIILADEPTANLDSATSQGILSLMSNLNKEEKITFIFSTHDPMVVKMAHRIIMIQDGRIAE